MLTKPLYLDDSSDVEAGTLNVATQVEVLERSQGRVRIAIDGWRKKMGLGRVIYYDFGLNILSAQLTSAAVKTDGVVSMMEQKEDDLTGLQWQKVRTELWTDADYLINDQQPLWDYARTSFRGSCSVCHSQPEESHFDANTWPGQFQGMLAFVNMDEDTQALVQKYLQHHSSTFAGKAH